MKTKAMKTVIMRAMASLSKWYTGS